MRPFWGETILRKTHPVAFERFDSPLAAMYQTKNPPIKGGDWMVEARVRQFASLPAAKIEEADNVRAVGAICHRHIACYLFDSPRAGAKNKTTPKGGFIFGGGEGSRTPVRKRFDKTFSGRS